MISKKVAPTDPGSLLCAVLSTLLFIIAAIGQGPPQPPPNKSTPVEAGELRETWNDRVSQGPPVGVMPEFEGWSMGTAMPLPRSEHAVVEMEGKIWVLGGYPPGRLPSNLVQVYDSTTGRWSLGPSLPQPIHHIHAAAVDGKLYVIGGEIEGASTGKPEKFVSNVWVHDPKVGGWVARAPMPTARSGGGKAVIDGKIYVAEVNAKFHILKPGPKDCKALHEQFFASKGGMAFVETNGTPAVADGRIYFGTRDELYCIGKKA